MSQAPFEDPFVDEIHKVREKLLEESGGDLNRLMDRLASREREDRSRVIADLKDAKAASSPRD
jgi:hypothetical protein